MHIFDGTGAIQMGIQWISTQIIVIHLDAQLVHFNGSHYLQVQGVAMGTCCASTYANLHLGGWEQKIFLNELLSLDRDNALCWYRYIDNIFLIWINTVSERFCKQAEWQSI